MTFTIRDARPDDAGTILRFITDLAIFEKAGHEVEATVESLTQSIFGEGSVTRARSWNVMARRPALPSGSTTIPPGRGEKACISRPLCRPRPSRAGAGKLLLRHLARIAVQEGCGRFEWSVLDWNEPAIRVYDAIGAEPQTEWIRYRMSGEALKAFAAG